MFAHSRLLIGLLLAACSGAQAQETPTETAPAETAKDAAEAVAPSTPEPAPIPRPALAERSDLAAQDLHARLPAEQQQWLEADKEPFLALWLPANVAPDQVQGMVILLPSDQRNPDDNLTLAPLRRQLPDHGWHSLSISLPDPLQTLPLRTAAPVSDAPLAEDSEANPAPKAEPVTAEDKGATLPVEQSQAAHETERLPVAEPAMSADTLEKNAAQHLERIYARIDAALEFAQQHKSPEIVLIGQGSGAYWSARYIQSRQPKAIKRLLWLSAQQPAGFNPTLDTLIGELKRPIGDFYYFRSNEQDAATARRNSSRRLGLNNYRSVGLSRLPEPEARQTQLLSRVRGWLSPQQP